MMNEKFNELVANVKMFGILATQFERFGSIHESELIEVVKSEVVTSNIDIDMLSKYNDYLADLGYGTYFDDDTLNEFLAGLTPLEILQKGFYGNYNYTKPYHCFNGYANLDSFDECDLEHEMRNDDGFITYLAKQLLDELEPEKIEELKYAGNLALAAGW